MKLIYRLGLLLLIAAFAAGAQAQPEVPHPRDVLGFTPGDDYKLARYDQLLSYFEALDEASDRVEMRQIGTSVLGRPLVLLFLSSAENLRNLEEWRQTSALLARARISETEAKSLSESGKAIVWIDGGLHATEVAGAQMTPLLAWRVATEESDEMRHIRDNTVMLLMPVMNPDGLDIIASWYDRTVGGPYEATRPPWLYHHFVGHDNNRDWFMNNMPESKAVTEVLYNQWYPQIVFNHHQTSPSWTRIFLPPFTDPVNPNIHPGVTTAVNLVGSAMANRFAMKQMPGVISGVTFSMWWNGGMRTVPYFHNMVGILTETGHATPSPRFFDPDSIPNYVGGRHPTGGTNIFYPDPWEGGWSYFKDPIDYMVTASMAVLRVAADRRSAFLYNIWRMGRDAIETVDAESPAAYVLPAEQWNAGEELALVNLLRTGGIEIHRANSAFIADSLTYSAGSFVIPVAQAFKPYLSDLLEPQAYPDRRQTPGGDPQVPYDLAGWTLPMQMGVQVDRIQVLPDSLDATLVTSNLEAPAGAIVGEGQHGYLVDSGPNRSRLAVNLAFQNGLDVGVLRDTLITDEHVWPPGSLVVERSRRVPDIAAAGADLHGIESAQPDIQAVQPAKIGLYKSWVSNMDEGWTRWLLGEYTFDADTLHDADVQSGDLDQYTAIILPHQSPNGLLHGHRTGMMPEEYTGGLQLSGAMALKEYVEQGGTLVALDAASDFLIEQFGLPVENVVDGLSSRQFFIPGSLVRITVDAAHPIGWGMETEAAASFVRSRAFEAIRRSNQQEGGRMEIAPGPEPPVEVIARYAEDDVLMSGWALGEEDHIAGEAAVVRVKVGEGHVILFGFRPQFRGQPRGTYKLFFNALLFGGMDAGS